MRFCPMLVLLLWSALDLPSATGLVRVGDAAHVYALEQHVRDEAMLEREFQASVEAEPEDRRFDLYCVSNQLSGAWSQVDWLYTLLQRAIVAALPSDEGDLRAALRDQALFVLWEIDETQKHLEPAAVLADKAEHARMRGAVLALLTRLRDTVHDLLAEEQARLGAVPSTAPP